MTNKDEMLNYFNDLFKQWVREDGSIEKHVPTPGGKDIVLRELQKDAYNLETEVCPYIREAGFAQSKSVLVEAAEEAANFLTKFPISGTIEVTLGALILVCGYRRQGLDLIVEAL